MTSDPLTARLNTCYPNVSSSTRKAKKILSDLLQRFSLSISIIYFASRSVFFCLYSSASSKYPEEYTNNKRGTIALPSCYWYISLLAFFTSLAEISLNFVFPLIRNLIFCHLVILRFISAIFLLEGNFFVA